MIKINKLNYCLNKILKMIKLFKKILLKMIKLFKKILLKMMFNKIHKFRNQIIMGEKVIWEVVIKMLILKTYKFKWIPKKIMEA